MAYRRISISEVGRDHPIAVFHRHWQRHAGPGRVMRRDDFRPFDFACLLPWIVILEKCTRDGVPAYRYRLCGSGCVELFQHDTTGGYFGDHLPAFETRARLAEFRAAEETLQPILSHHELALAGREHVLVLRGVFPVAARGAAPDQIFVLFAGADERCPCADIR